MYPQGAIHLLGGGTGDILCGLRACKLWLSDLASRLTSRMTKGQAAG